MPDAETEVHYSQPEQAFPDLGIFSQRNLFIHGLRGILAFSLFFFHVIESKLPTFPFMHHNFTKLFLFSTERGVELFFGISGIVIVLAYRQAKTPLRFLVNRVTRIYPVLWVTLLSVLAISVMGGRYTPDFMSAEPYLTVAANALALPTLVPVRLIHPAAWTLSYEIAFYLFVLFFGVSLKFLPKKVALVLLGLFGTAFLCFHLRALPFALGALVVALTGKINPRHVLFRAPGVMIALAFLAWHHAFFIVDPERQLQSFFDFYTHPEALALFVFATVCAFGALGGIFYGNGILSKVVTSKVILWLGTISFSLYMWQTVVMGCIKWVLMFPASTALFGQWSQTAFFVIALPPTLYISHLSQVYIEDRLTRSLRAYFKNRFEKAPKAAFGLSAS